jgi:hypothetical protein
MKCAVHVEADATGFCRNCGKALCTECKREVQGALYCEECLAKSVSQPAVPPGGPNPGLAAFLGLIPGLGAIYNNQYVKAAIHFGIFAGLVSLLDTGDLGGLEPLFGMSLGALFIYMPIDAYKTAKARLMGRTYEGPFERLGANPSLGAYFLIALGGLFLLQTTGLVSVARIFSKGWPVILIILGVLMLRTRMQRPPEETKRDGQ